MRSARMRSSADFSRFCFVGVVVATFFMPLNGYCMMLIVPLSSQTISRRRVDNILVNHGSSLSSSSFAFAKSKRPDRSSYNHRRSTSQGTTTYLALESPTPPSASADADIKPDASEETAPTTPSSSLDVPPVLASLTNNINGSNNTKATTTTRVPKNQSSKRAMLGFAIPALGIYLANPLLSNIDNAFVGQTVGTAGLAALSPATICTDQLLYLFSFLGRATTGIVARAYAANGNDNDDKGDVEAARKAASAPLTVSLVCGFALSLFYAFQTPSLLSILNVNVALRPASSSYIYWRGAIAWAALAQSVCLSVMMATRDSITPVKIVALASVVNVIGDYLLCAWPFRWGCSGAAAATAGATLVSCGFMLQALARKKLLPRIGIPTRKEIRALTEFTGPLLAITITRLGGTVAMQRAAMRLGLQSLAGYQLCINLLFFFVLFGEPLSQLSQTKLPSLLDRGDSLAVSSTYKSILTLAVYTSLGVAAVAYFVATYGAGLISSDLGVHLVAKAAAPSLFLNVAAAIFAIAVDGAMLASRDFGFLLCIGLSTFLLQLKHLTYCTSVNEIFGTFTLRLSLYSVAVLARVLLGFGNVGRVIRSNRGAATTPAKELRQ